MKGFFGSSSPKEPTIEDEEITKDFEDELNDSENKDFKTYLEEAKQTDLSDISHSGCVSLGFDFKHQHIIVMIPAMALNNKPDKRPEQTFRRMLLYFLLKTHELVGQRYSIVYAHTNIDLINQYPLIYKFYSILPRSYKKNLLKMYVIHPNKSIKMFFEFSRVFLSHKFYAKLTLCENILTFQCILPPNQLYLPPKFLRKEDEENEYKYYNQLASIQYSFVNKYGTIETLYLCQQFLLFNHGLMQAGLFRIPGDENELNLIKIRLQYSHLRLDLINSSLNSTNNTTITTNNPSYSSDSHANTTHSTSNTTSGPRVSRVTLSENNRSLIFGDLEYLNQNLFQKNVTKYEVKTTSPTTSAYVANTPKKLSRKDSTAFTIDEILASEPPMSIIVVTNIHTIAQTYKLAIRDLPEALVPNVVYNNLIAFTRRYDLNNLSSDWQTQIAMILSKLPYENISTLGVTLRFLQQVASEKAVHSMDEHNLAIVFTPTIFNPEMHDAYKALMELKITQTILETLIVKPYIFEYALRLFKQEHYLLPQYQSLMEENPLFQMVSLDAPAPHDLFKDQSQQQRLSMKFADRELPPEPEVLTTDQLDHLQGTITAGMSKTMLQRMNLNAHPRGGGGAAPKHHNILDEDSNPFDEDTNETHRHSLPINSNRYSLGNHSSNVYSHHEDTPLPPVPPSTSSHPRLGHNHPTPSHTNDSKHMSLALHPPSHTHHLHEDVDSLDLSLNHLSVGHRSSSSEHEENNSTNSHHRTNNNTNRNSYRQKS